jgi:hypothetical protein
MLAILPEDQKTISEQRKMPFILTVGQAERHA